MEFVYRSEQSDKSKEIHGRIINRDRYGLGVLMTLQKQHGSVLRHVRWALPVLAALHLRDLAETKIHIGDSIDLNVPILEVAQ